MRLLTEGAHSPSLRAAVVGGPHRSGALRARPRCARSLERRERTHRGAGLEQAAHDVRERGIVGRDQAEAGEAEPLDVGRKGLRRGHDRGRRGTRRPRRPRRPLRRAGRPALPNRRTARRGGAAGHARSISKDGADAGERATARDHVTPPATCVIWAASGVPGGTRRPGTVDPSLPRPAGRRSA